MSWKNYLTPQQLRNFKRRARFTVCGMPADVFTEPDGVLFVTVNHNSESGASWYEGTPYHETEDGTFYDPTEEIAPFYVKKLRKADDATARRIIAKELHVWARYPDTVAGWSPEQIAAEADRISRG